MKYMILFVALIALLQTPCYASDYTDAIISQRELETLTESIPERVYDLIEDYNILSGEGLEVVWEKIKNSAIAIAALL